MNALYVCLDSKKGTFFLGGVDVMCPCAVDVL